MAWFKINESFPESPRAIELSASAFRGWVEIGCWLAKHDADPGNISEHAIRFLLRGRGKASVLNELIEYGFLVPTADGYKFPQSHYGFDDLPPHAWRIEQPVVSRRKIPDEVRRAVYERDGYVCLICSATDDLTLDHIHPYSLGGADTYDNLRTLCRPCNSAKGARV
jgi:hypothetical protein